MDTIIRYRNKITGGLYRNILKPIFFRIDPETTHDRMTEVGAMIGRYRIGRLATTALFDYKNPALEQEIMGISFKNPIGLSAGFDKDARLTDILPSVGFGFAEVGSITAKPCLGNSKPRLWRLPNSKSLAVYYGLKNEGCEIVAERLKNKQTIIPIGISVAMTNCKDNIEIDNAIADYAETFKVMEPAGDYITINISCPNAEGGQPFAEPLKLDRLLSVIDKIPTTKPIFLKLAPDLTLTEVDNLLDIARAHRVHGLICTNLTKNRNNPKIIDAEIPRKGGLSGRVVKNLSDELIAHIYKRGKGRFILIGCGGVFTAEDAYKKIKLGASLVQMITGMIYEGPQVISEINRGLSELLKRDGFTNISQAIGADNR